MTILKRFGAYRSGWALAAITAMVVTTWGGIEWASADDGRNVTLDRGTPYIIAAGRSPIPQAGENITEPLPYKRLVDTRGDEVKAKAPDGPVTWGAAHNYVGQRITVEGKIVNTYNHEGNICFLNFHEDWRGKFYIPVFSEVFADLPEPPETYFLNKTIRVTGKVTQHRNRPNIEVRNIGMIEIID
ncbi:MAG: OB-fold nucleic acid binding domain-containing protein [Planctomycetota bacterium]